MRLARPFAGDRHIAATDSYSECARLKGGSVEHDTHLHRAKGDLDSRRCAIGLRTMPRMELRRAVASQRKIATASTPLVS